ncbi:MAG: DNA-binding protein [Bacteroidetes bacterium MED-G17]|nr:MAG: DNA-binding protein [Bacteroidetes bacterium MED-G17]|tara:strand:- start:2677 stop:2982 length:306 start_codon:yes stop_codon:yes gene_type:complete
MPMSGNFDGQEVFSKRVKAGKRTYFFDVKSTRSNDYYITITESKKRHDDGGYVKHKIFLYKEDFNKFVDAFNETINHVKTELMPEYDFDEFQRAKEENFED